jgi:hypothetical protein
MRRLFAVLTGVVVFLASMAGAFRWLSSDAMHTYYNPVVGVVVLVASLGLSVGLARLIQGRE